MSVAGILKAELGALERDREKLERALEITNGLESEGWSLETKKFILSYLNDNELCVLHRSTILDILALNKDEDSYTAQDDLNRIFLKLNQSLEGGLPH